MINEDFRETDPNDWKQEEPEKKRNKQVIREVECVGFGVRPTVKVKLLSTPSVPLFIVEDREELKSIATLSEGQRVVTKHGEHYKYNASRNMWLLQNEAQEK